MEKKRRVLLIAEWQVGSLMEGVASYANKHNWHLVIWHAGDVREAIRDWRGDGIIANLPYRGLFAPGRLVNEPMKLVSCVPLKYRSIPYTLVREDDAAIGRLAAEYFVKCGFQHFAVYSQSQRGRAFRHALCGMGFGDCEHLGTRSSAGRVCAWLRKLPKPCALLAENDWDASDIINWAMINQIEIPGELSILGVGNDSLVCRASSIELSSIDSRLLHLGFSAAAELDRLLDGGEARPEGISISPSPLPVERESVNFAVRGEPRLREIVEFMESRLSEPLGIHALARRFGLSDSSLYKLFTAQYHASPKQVLLRLRLRKAATMMRDGGHNLKEVAEEAGFPSPTAFFSAFKAMYGCTPRKWMVTI